MSTFDVDELLLAVNLTPFDSILYFDENSESDTLLRLSASFHDR